MIVLSYFICSVLCVVIGVYAIYLLQQMRLAHKHEYLNSLFYYQLLSLIFGVYGILGSMLIRQILPKFDISVSGIETISHFLPFLGLPFLLAGWFLFFKMAFELANKKISQFISISYFFFATLLFLLFGFYLLRLSDNKFADWNVIRNQVFIGFGLTSFLVEGLVALVVFIVGAAKRNKMQLQIAGVIIIVAVLKIAALYFYDIHFTIGLYYLALFFSAVMPLVFIIRKYIGKIIVSEPQTDNHKNTLYIKYSITPREKEIIEEICTGKTNKEIAETLFITLQTVKDHTHNIFQKTEVKNRLQLSNLFSAVNERKTI